MDIKKLIAVATGKIPHNYRNGLCPDELPPESLDQDCPACKILIEAATEHDAMECRQREAEGKKTAEGGSPLKRLQTLSARVAELEAERAEREKQGPVFWCRPLCHGGMYEGPLHHKTPEGEVRREEDPGEWVPLYAATPVTPVTPVTAQVRLNDSEMEMITRAHGTGGWQTLGDMVRFARAIETAVLRANGFKVEN